ncbi:MAG TPA: hypothetical protein VH210_00690 [Gaiellaceae bacterium]|jgi:hypothetical protein|nr:hypothetical protein [Gaiellaceae bacterium]
MSQLKKLLVALTPMGAAAYVAGGGTFSKPGDLFRWVKRPTHRAVAPAESTKGDPLWRTKKALLLMMAIGAAAYFGFSGTFANFQAETANNGSSISSGTLTMNNQVNTNAACFSYSAASADNINAGCDAPFAITNVAPGTFTSTQVAKITLTNSGSIDASKLYLYASQVNGKLSTPLTAGQLGVTTLVLSASGLEGSVATSDNIVVSYGGHSQTFVASAPAVGGATTISITSATSNFAFPAGSIVTDASGNTSASNTDCFDSKTTVPINSSTTGSQLNFNPTAGNPFCGSVLMWIQEVAGANTYCWFGKGSTWNPGGEDANGRCIAPISVTTSGISGTITAIPLTGGVLLNGNVRANDTILVTQGTHTQTFTASAATTFGATSISVNSTAVGSPFTAGATVTDTSAQSSLDSNAPTDNVTAFQTAHHLSGGKLELFPVNGNGTIDQASGASELTKYNGSNFNRTFYVGLYLPVPGGSNQNALQGLASTFGLTWHIDQ